MNLQRLTTIAALACAGFVSTACDRRDSTVPPPMPQATPPSTTPSPTPGGAMPAPPTGTGSTTPGDSASAPGLGASR
jgi:hypothetical protein